MCQIYIGGSLDYGNRYRFMPEYDRFTSPFSFFGSVNLLVNENLGEKYTIQYGFSGGIASARISYDFFPDWPDGYLYGDGFLNFGRLIKIKQHKFTFSAGAGIAVLASYGVTATAHDASMLLYEYDLESRSGQPLGFMQMGVSTFVLPRFAAMIQYKYHFQPAVTGEYFIPAGNLEGDISLKLRFIRLMVSYQLIK
ncbi:MAG: hypothetical protein ACOCXH_08990 [Cyclobacteriaceae bacterium]